MRDYIISARDKVAKVENVIAEWLKSQFLVKKFNSFPGYLVLFALSLAIALLISTQGLKMGIMILGAIIGIPFVFACMFNLRFGIITVFVLGFTLQGVKRVIDVPLGVLLDALIVVMLFGLFIKQVKERDWSFAKNDISKMVLIWILYNLMAFANPDAASRLAWVYSVRAIAVLMIFYFILAYAFSDLQFIVNVLKLVVGFVFLAGLYTYFQEFYGLQDWEKVWLTADPERHHLLVQWGRTRKFSFLADPTVLGIVLGFTSVFCFVMTFGPYSMGKRVWSGIGCAMMMMAMVYTGTRTAYVIWPAGFFFYVILNMNRNMLVLASIVFAAGFVLVTIPTSNPDLYRIQSAFNPMKTDSFEVRLENQEFIRPFIHSHPLGGGLGSTGVMGERFSPGHILAGFPPDSGFVRVAIELGWIGLGIYCALLYVALKTGVKNYYRLQDPYVKNLYGGVLALFYAMIISNYPQESIANLPTNLIFYMCLALLVRLKDFDKKYLHV